MALSLPETEEREHMDHPDFRVRGKIFATLGYPDEHWAMVKLNPDQQQAFTQSEPSVYSPVTGGWGRRGATSVRLKAADKTSVHRALRTAWRNTAGAEPNARSRDSASESMQSPSRPAGRTSANSPRTMVRRSNHKI